MFLKAVGSDAYLGLWIWLKVYFMPALVCVQSGLRVVYFFLGGAEMFWQCDWPQHTQLSGRNVRLWKTNCTVELCARACNCLNLQIMYMQEASVCLCVGVSFLCVHPSLTLRVCWDRRTKWGLSINVLFSLSMQALMRDFGGMQKQRICVFITKVAIVKSFFLCFFFGVIVNTVVSTIDIHR